MGLLMYPEKRFSAALSQHNNSEPWTDLYTNPPLEYINILLGSLWSASDTLRSDLLDLLWRIGATTTNFSADEASSGRFSELFSELSTFPETSNKLPSLKSTLQGV